MTTILTQKRNKIYLKKLLAKEETQISRPQSVGRIDRVTLKEKTKLVDEVIESVQASNITEYSKLVKCGALLIIQLLGIKEINNKYSCSGPPAFKSRSCRLRYADQYPMLIM